MKKWLVVGACLIGSGSAQASIIPDLTAAGSFSSFTTDSVSTVLRTIAIGTDTHVYHPAGSLGLIGFDLGVDITFLTLPSDFQTLMTLATGNSTVPSSLPIPKFSIRKGLPGGIDLGFSFFTSGTTTSFYGGDVKYSILDGGLVAPSLAVRLGAEFSKVWFLSSSTYTLDVMLSKSLAILEPYVGAGLQYWSGSIDTAGLTIPVAASSSGINPHFYAGLQMKMLILRIAGGVDVSTSGITTYGLRGSIGL